MAQSERVQQILAQLAAAAGTGAPGTMGSRLVAACQDSLGVSGVGLISMTDRGPGTLLAATDGHAQVIEELQFSLGEGPCIDASRLGRPLLQPQLAQTGPPRWPAFTAAAIAAGVAAIFAFPLHVGGIKLGVLDVSHQTAGMLGPADLTDALGFADAATLAILQLQAIAGDAPMHPEMVAAMEDRAVVHQATGMISVQMNSSLADALVLLRARAYAAERPIRQLATDVVNHVVRLDDR
ncbi:MAG TPA: GAF and ANTAR domain-containing protein [Propionibacteriaceae bacterium]|nr:GAF and ANTAR domain-containing protein [Propionibacteriaceae bacterium]